MNSLLGKKIWIVCSGIREGLSLSMKCDSENHTQGNTNMLGNIFLLDHVAEILESFVNQQPINISIKIDTTLVETLYRQMMS